MRDGFVVIRRAFEADTAARCRELIWAAAARRGARSDDPATWPSYLRVDDLEGEPFTAASTAQPIAGACDSLIGGGRWTSPISCGRTFNVVPACRPCNG
jgi:hypothetical protein